MSETVTRLRWDRGTVPHPFRGCDVRGYADHNAAAGSAAFVIEHEANIVPGRPFVLRYFRGWDERNGYGIVGCYSTMRSAQRGAERFADREDSI